MEPTPVFLPGESWAAVYGVAQNRTGLKRLSSSSSSIQKNKIVAAGPITSWQIDGETMQTVIDFIFLGSHITTDGDAAMKLKDACSLKEQL